MKAFEMTRAEFLKTAGAAGLLAAVPATTAGCAKNPAADIAANILIIGGGAAGISMAVRLRRALDKATITIVDPAEKHFYQPGFTMIGGGIWKDDCVWMYEKDLIPSGTRWIRDSVVAVEAAQNRAVLASGEKLSYDFLVLVPGIQCNWTQIEGITQADLGKGDAHSIYDYQGSVRTWAGIQKFVQKGGYGLYVDTYTKLKCGGAPKKICLLTEHYARRQGVREKLKFDYITGAKALYNVPHFTPRLEEIYRERNIPVTVDTRLTGVDVSAKKAHFLTVDHKTKKETRFTKDYDFLHFAPPQSAPDFVRKSGLGWTEGSLAREAWVMVDKKTFVHKTFPNIVSLGDVAGIPTSKTSAAIRKQVPIAVANLCCLIAGKAPEEAYDGYAACPIITDYGHVLMAEFDYDKKAKISFPLSLFDMSKESRIAWMLKAHVLKPLYFKLMLRGLC